MSARASGLSDGRRGDLAARKMNCRRFAVGHVFSPLSLEGVLRRPSADEPIDVVQCAPLATRRPRCHHTLPRWNVPRGRRAGPAPPRRRRSPPDAPAHGVIPALAGRHQTAEADPARLGQRLQGSDTANVFLDPEQRGGPNRIGLVRTHLGDVVGRCPPLGQERLSLRAGRVVRPRRRAAARSPRTMCAPERFHHAFAHEGRGPGPPVRALRRRHGRHRSASRRSRSLRQRTSRPPMPADTESAALLRACRRHCDLIHDPARCTHHVVLRLLAQRRQANGSMDPAPRARAVATSSAALEATPTDTGRSDVISTAPAGSSITP